MLLSEKNELEALKQKLHAFLNEQKYPADRVRGQSRKYSEY